MADTDGTGAPKKRKTPAKKKSTAAKPRKTVAKTPAAKETTPVTNTAETTNNNRAEAKSRFNAALDEANGRRFTRLVAL